MRIFKNNNLSDEERAVVLRRPAVESAAKIEKIVSDILNNIKKNGDDALFNYSKTLDHFDGDNLMISEVEILDAEKRLNKKLKIAIDEAFVNISNFHKEQTPRVLTLTTADGIVCESRTHALDSVGLYVPGGSAPLVSTALMLAIPAMVAGCREVVLCSPPPISDAILYAASLCNVHKIFNIGGAQAIGAMAYGTKTVPKVSKIFGPGNQYVTMAKSLVRNDPQGAAIDMPAGPSEVLVIADEHANAAYVAADLLSQAEHGPDSQVMLVTTSLDLAYKVKGEIDNECAFLSRSLIARQALTESSILIVNSIDEAIAISNTYAPEHLILQIKDAEKYLNAIRNAGSIFVGAYTPESLGDYASGTNHTLPTYGYARTYSALGTDDFRRRYTLQRATKEGLEKIASTITTLAKAEGLDAHGYAVTVRLEK